MDYISNALKDVTKCDQNCYFPILFFSNPFLPLTLNTTLATNMGSNSVPAFLYTIAERKKAIKDFLT
jgi:hypothetical protein